MSTKYNPKILTLLRAKQDKAGIKYLGVGDKPYIIVKVLFYLAFAYSFIFNLLALLASYSQYGAYMDNIGTPSESQMEEIATLKNNLITILLLSIIMVLAVIFVKYKRHTISIILTVISSVPLLFSLYRFMNFDKVGLTVYLIHHGIPLTLFLILGCVLSFIAFRQNRLDRKAYDKLVDSIYGEYKEQFLNLKDDEWEAFLENYEPEIPERVQKRLEKKLNRKTKGKKKTDKESDEE